MFHMPADCSTTGNIRYQSSLQTVMILGEGKVWKSLDQNLWFRALWGIYKALEHNSQKNWKQLNDKKIPHLHMYVHSHPCNNVSKIASQKGYTEDGLGPNSYPSNTLHYSVGQQIIFALNI